MIQVNFEADSLPELLTKINEFLGPYSAWASRTLQEPTGGPQGLVQGGSGLAPPIVPPKPKRASKAAPAPVEIPLDQQENNAEEEPYEAEGKEPPVDAKAKAAVDLLKLKAEQLDRLRDLFNAGKGLFVRELLAKYGNGAKVFPEVDARHFPQIKADIDRELN